MKGIKIIELSYRDIHYSITLNRNISIIRGDSGTGKTTFHSCVEMFNKRGASSGVRLGSTAPCHALSGNWEADLILIQSFEDHILITDEENGYTHTEKFASIIKNSSNYFVLITREDMPNIPYSINAIYDLSTLQVGKQYYVTNHERYISTGFGTSIVDCILTEDGKSGRQFMRKTANIQVLDTEKNGNSNLSDNCNDAFTSNKTPLVFADGAALGAFAEDLYKYARNNAIYLWAPESFEYLLLLSKIVWRRDVNAILRNTVDQISSELFISWERFFTWLVTDIMKDYTGHEYSKAVLKPWYYSEENKRKFLSIVPDDIKKYFM